MKRISKVMIVIASVITIIAMMVVNCYAWQNTNEIITDIVTTGGQSYNLTPIKAIYITRPRTNNADEDFHDIYTQSIQHQNVYTVEGKGNFQLVGYELTGSRTETQNNWNDIKFNTSTINTWTEAEKRELGYIGCRTDDITYPNTFGTTLYQGNQGSVFDEFIYMNHAAMPWDIRTMAYVYEFNDFIVGEQFIHRTGIFGITNHYLLADNAYDPQIKISYSVSMKDEHGVVYTNNINEYVGWAKNTLSPSTTYVSGVPYETKYKFFDIGDHIFKHLPMDRVQDGQLILVQGLQIGCGVHEDEVSQAISYWDRPLQSNLIQQYYRPYATKVTVEGEQRNIYSFDETNPLEILSIDYRNVQDFIEGGATLNLDGFKQLGDTIGDSVQGVFDVEIFPNISIWTLLMIPFSLGVVFALLRYFAGG